MSRIGSLGLVMTLTIVIASCGSGTVADADDPSFVFVVSASSGSMTDDTLTLEGVPSLVYFSDRPERIAGHTSLERLAEVWDRGPDSFADDPPNGVLSLVGDDTTDNNIVVEITDLRVDGATVTFGIVPLEGTIPNGEFGPASLFIDDSNPIGPINVIPG